MNKLTGGFWGLLICVLTTMCGGCKTKKTITTTTHKQTYDSAAVIKETTHTTFSIIDTTHTSEFTKTITEYVFSVPIGMQDACVNEYVRDTTHFAHLTNEASKKPFVPMVIRKSDGTLQINYGLTGIKQTTEESKDEQKGITQSKDSTSCKDTNTKVARSENTKKTDKQIEKVQIAQPFCWWQQIGALIIIGVILYCLWRYRPTIRNITKHVLNKIKRI